MKIKIFHTNAVLQLSEVYVTGNESLNICFGKSSKSDSSVQISAANYGSRIVMIKISRQAFFKLQIYIVLY